MAPHTIVLNSNGNLNVPCLYENGDEVVVNWNWLDNDFDDSNPAARFATLFISLPALCLESFVCAEMDRGILLFAHSIRRASCPLPLILPRVRYIFCYQVISSPRAPSGVF